MLPSNPTTPAASDASSSAPAPVPCTVGSHCDECAYDLRGLSPEAPCPECGGTTRNSTPLLREAPPGFLAKLLLALNLMRFGLAGVTFCVVVALFMVLPFWNKLADPPVWVMAAFLLVALLVILAGCALFAATFEPFTKYEAAEAARRGIRPAVVVIIAGPLLALLCAGVGGAMGPDWLAPAVWVAGALMAASGFSLLVLYLALVDYSIWLALCVPDRKLASRGKRYLWMLPAICVLTCCILWIGPIVSTVLLWRYLTDLRFHLVTALLASTPAPRY